LDIPDLGDSTVASTKRTSELPQPTVLLTTLAVSDRAEIVKIEGGNASQLSGFGFYPGAIIHIHQKFPSYIVRTDQTELALETEVASRIWVRQVRVEGQRGRGKKRKWRRRGGSSW
jgi:DtxR family Mn-dependent transcriptional regulator